MPTKILCATDGSEHSRIAVLHAAQMAKTGAASLVFVTVNVALGAAARGPVGYKFEEGEVQRILDEAAAIAKEAGVSDCKTESVRSRDTAYAVVQQAEELGVDHIVVGTGDRSLASRLMLGSVSREVASKAHCSVTIAR
jgi:nucleotide-binding universal stress UspA family protein